MLALAAKAQEILAEVLSFKPVPGLVRIWITAKGIVK